MSVVLYFVIPCYNDSDTLPVSAPVFKAKLGSLIRREKASPDSRLVFVDDGSSDGTFSYLRGMCESDKGIIALKLDGNYGEQNAILAGTEYAYNKGAEAVVSIDSDLQENINAVDGMLDKLNEGCDIALGVRSARGGDTKTERFMSSAFYTLNGAFKTGLVKEHSNYRMMNRKAIAELLTHKGETYFLPALASGLNGKKAFVSFERKSRAAGESRYNFKSKLRLAALSICCHTERKPVKAVIDKFNIKEKLNFKAEYRIEEACGE
ncbi:MAG: glycosyltransferase [Eubacterium sp.]|nr:glycosyltransferase [Eubacterium sp.]